MTMRQVTGLLKVINKAHLVDFYHSLLSYATIQGQKLPSLNEFLNISLNQSPKEEKVFDEKTDKILEEQALKRLNERRKSVE